MQHYLNFIDGQWRDSSRQLEVINPATAETFATVAQASIEDADAAMTAAHQCASSGVLTNIRPAQRTAWLLKAADAIREIAAEGALILCRENGKNLETAREEFDEAARYFEYYAGMADKIEGISVPLGKDYIDFTSTGFISKNLTGTYIYTVIRRPNKPPTSGTQVYNVIARTGTGAAATVTGVGFAPDLVIAAERATALDTGQ